MKTILTIGLILTSLLAMAAQGSVYAPAWGGRDLATQARLLGRVSSPDVAGDGVVTMLAALGADSLPALSRAET